MSEMSIYKSSERQSLNNEIRANGGGQGYLTKECEFHSVGIRGPSKFVDNDNNAHGGHSYIIKYLLR